MAESKDHHCVAGAVNIPHLQQTWLLTALPLMAMEEDSDTLALLSMLFRFWVEEVAWMIISSCQLAP